MALYPVYVGTNLKILYMPLVNDDHFLGLCMVGNTVAAMFGAPLWGHLADANGFKIIFIIIAVIDTLTKLFGLFAESKMSIALLLILLGFVDKGMVTIVGPGLV